MTLVHGRFFRRVGCGRWVVCLMSAAAAWLAGCTVAGGGAVEEGVTEVAIRGFQFIPDQVTIKVGERVRWTNFDAAPHTATSGNPEDADAGSIWASPNLTMGQSFTFQFDEAGEFVYHCEVHPAQMRGARVVVEP
ncbi:MAG: cupredoxin domain-containing protein [Planctomycetes bacterium]|nr:cupredoxin domain-containing protein [Planctomycetota bacterium]